MIIVPQLEREESHKLSTIVEYIHLQQLHFEISKYSLFAFACKYRERNNNPENIRSKDTDSFV